MGRSAPPVSSQLRAPATTPDMLARPRLTGMLRAASGFRIVLLCADAGYGKTTLLTQFHAVSPGTTVWYALSERDADFSVFFTRLSEAVGNHFRSARKILERYLATHPSLHTDIQGAANVFVDTLARAARRDLYLILDDAHLLKDSRFVPPFLAAVVDQLPPQMHLVVASRHEPPLPLPLWRARHQMMELRNAEFRFVREELVELYTRVLKLELRRGEVDLLLQRTEGWVAGLRWIAERMRLAGEIEGVEPAIADLVRGSGGLSEFYEAELFRILPEREQQFLARIASLESFGEELAAVAWKARDRAQILKTLIRRNLLTATSIGAGTEYRVHPLFREFLLDRAQAVLPPEERARLLEALGRKLLEFDPASALDQWRMIPAPGLVAAWLARSGDAFLKEGRYLQLESLLSSIPRPVLEETPRLRLLRAEARRILGDVQGALEDFRGVEREARLSGEFELEADASLGAAKIYTARGDAERSLRLGRSLLQRGSRLRPEVRARLLQLVGGAYFYLGRYRDSETTAREMLEHLRNHPDIELEMAAEHNLALTCCATGRFTEARALFEQHLRRPEVAASRRRPLHLSNLALLEMESGEPGPARKSILEAESLVEKSGSALQRASVRLARAELELRLGNLSAVERLVDEMAAGAKAPPERVIEVGVLLLRARCRRKSGDVEGARALAEEATRALGDERGSLWFDLRQLRAELLIAAGRPGRSATALSALIRDAARAGLRHVETRACLSLAAVRWEDGDEAGAVHTGTRGLRIAVVENYEQMVLEIAVSVPGLFVELWGRGVQEAWLAQVFSRDSERFWPILASRWTEAPRIRPGLAETLGDCADASCIPLLAAWQARGGASGSEARRALRALERRTGSALPRVSSPEVRVSLMGPLEVRVRGERLSLRAFRTQRAAELFAYLALRGKEGESRDRIMHLFWPGASLAEARRNLSPTLGYLREAFRPVESGREPLKRERGRVWLELGPGSTFDLDPYRNLAARHAGGRPVDPEMEQLARECLEATRGEFLEGWDSEWIVEERRALRETRRLAQRLCAASARREGRHVEAERWLRDGLTDNPTDEMLHRELLETLGESGEFARLWAEYREFLDRLRREGIRSPEPRTLQLVARLKGLERECAKSS